MNNKISYIFGLGIFSALATAGSLAQQVNPRATHTEETETVLAPDIIFNNLDPVPGARYNTKNTGFPVAGKRAENNITETWFAVAFTPREDVMATQLAAAVGYISGDKLVALGIYSDDDGTVGQLLPGGEGTTTRIPDADECCDLATVTLPGEGVALSAGTHYWLVAQPDNINGPTFRGEWHYSNRAASAYLQPPLPWNPQTGAWPAAQIRGKKITDGGAARQVYDKKLADELAAPDGTVTIFRNLAPDPADRGFFNGVVIDGKSQGEVWEALPFTPRANVHATTLAAAIGWVSGTKEINLGIYSDNAGAPGALLPGGQGSTTDIPDLYDCCQLAKVTLPGPGVALTAGTQYWLVASPDNVNAPDFEGRWQSSNLALSSYQQPELFLPWTNNDGDLLAAEIRGTLP